MADDGLSINIPKNMLDGIQSDNDDTASNAYIEMRAHIIERIKNYGQNDDAEGAFNIANGWFDLIINSCEQPNIKGGQTRRKKNKVLNKTRKK